MVPEFKTTWLGSRREIIIWDYERGLLYQDGKFSRLLNPGKYSFWRWEKVMVKLVGVRQMSEVVTGQSILTADKIEVRVSLIAQYRVSDPVLAINSVESYVDQLYQDLQLVLRDIVAGYEIDALLNARGELGVALLEQVGPGALEYGVTLTKVGVRDVVLPGNIRNIFSMELEADRMGRAELVKARHETAAARARANTARILSENPNIARMQELDALVNIAGRNGSVVLLPRLADLLVQRLGRNGEQ